jgi:hypothetical protein
MTLPPPGFRSRSRLVRALCLAAALVVVGVVVTIAGNAIGLPNGYGSAQSNSATSLARRSAEWAAFRRGTRDDIALYIPLYLIVGLSTIAVVSPRPAGVPTTSQRRRLIAPPGVIWLAMFGMGVADLAETLLFRASLGRLIGGATAADIDTLARTTRVLTGLKFVSLAVSLLLLVWHVVIREPAQP